MTAPTHRRGDATLRVFTTANPERMRRGGVAVATLPRTFLDLTAAGFPIDRLVHEAAGRRLIGLTALRSYAEARRGRPGAKRLLTAATNPHYRSRTERDFHAWLTDRGIVVTPNAPIDGLTVDFLVSDHDLVIEVDPEQTHGTVHASRTDARRDERLRQRGLEVVRVTSRP